MTHFKNKKVLIMGLGLHGGGVGVARFFAKQKAKVLVTDLKTKKQLKESVDKLKGLPIKFALGGHKEKDFLNSDLVVKNPDVPSSSPYLEIAKKNNVPVETDISLFFKLSGAFIIGVTGTKGKSTTASLIYHLLKPKYKRLFLAGNIGVSPLEFLPKVRSEDKVVLELSSFGLEDLKQSPNIAIITNILPDHLNRYANMAEYIESKKLIFKYQTKNDYLFLNKDIDDILRRSSNECSKMSIVRQFEKEAGAKVWFFSGKNINMDGLKIFGEHNKSNIAAAIEVAKLLKVPAGDIKKSLKTFRGVPSRQEFVKEVRGVKYFNDTTATMPDAVITAIKSFSEKFPKSKLIFICGGQNKGLDYHKMAREIEKNVAELIMLPGTASDKIKEHLSSFNKIHEVPLMEKAVGKAKQISQKGDVVVLSPGAASFNLFKNEFDRGSQFIKFVKKLK